MRPPTKEIEELLAAELLASDVEAALAPVLTRPARRGTTNKNARGGSEERRRRRERLVQTYRADVDLFTLSLYHGPEVIEVNPGDGEAACRCYRCGVLLTVDTVTVDRIIPGIHGGTYRRNNIRPACGRCNSSTGATTRRKAKR
jgi:5-methylcytosine-specific restriction endonuclease McrA